MKLTKQNGNVFVFLLEFVVVGFFFFTGSLNCLQTLTALWIKDLVFNNGLRSIILIEEYRM